MRPGKSKHGSFAAYARGAEANLHEHAFHKAGRSGSTAAFVKRVPGSQRFLELAAGKELTTARDMLHGTREQHTSEAGGVAHDNPSTPSQQHRLGGGWASGGPRPRRMAGRRIAVREWQG